MNVCHICGSSPAPIYASSATETRHYCCTMHRNQDLPSLSTGRGMGLYRPEIGACTPRHQVYPTLRQTVEELRKVTDRHGIVSPSLEEFMVETRGDDEILRDQTKGSL